MTSAAATEAGFLRPLEINALPSTPADRVVAYGPGSQQSGELRLPPGTGPHPVAIVIHGGCWKAFPGADVHNTAPMASALTAAGVATWNIGYRRVDEPGGGWPSTFQDIAAAVDRLHALAEEHPLDLRRVVVVGHSAGGHLGTWAAARGRLPEGNALRGARPLQIAGVLNLAGPADLKRFRPQDSSACGDAVIERLLGGTPEAVPGHYAQGSPAQMLPIGVRQILLTGAHDPLVPPAYGSAYAARARRSGDDVSFTEIGNAAHFEVIAPSSAAWPVVEAAVRTLLDMPARAGVSALVERSASKDDTPGRRH